MSIAKKTRQDRKDRKAAVLQRDGNRCVYCGGTDDLTMDHLLTRWARGGSSQNNLATACVTCNNLRSNLTLEQWHYYCANTIGMHFDIVPLLSRMHRAREHQLATNTHHLLFTWHVPPADDL